jgi:hypothetical protein
MGQVSSPSCLLTAQDTDCSGSNIDVVLANMISDAPYVCLDESQTPAFGTLAGADSEPSEPTLAGGLGLTLWALFVAPAAIKVTVGDASG